MNMDDILNIEKVLDYCDVPQLFIARDAFDTLFICLLYEDDPVCKYTGIKISSKKLNNFYDGKCDLRSLFVQPENSNEYFDIIYDKGKYRKSTCPESQLDETRLPAEGYKMDSEEREEIVVNIPVKDRNLLSELVHKFGWACM
jgi:hypothetical protein